MKKEKISIILPTYNEGKSIKATISEIKSILADDNFQILVVDDSSTDNTEQAAKESSAHVLVRKNKRGLASAIMHGFQNSKTDLVFVLDADGQHNPSPLPDMINALRSNSADLVIGSRYLGKKTDMNFERKSISQIATFLSKPLAPKISDPLSGFFGVRLSKLSRNTNWHLIGYKLLLEILSKNKTLRIKEYPFHFRARKSGASKISIFEVLRHLELLAFLYLEKL